MTEYEKNAQHYVRLAKEPGFRDHVLFRLDELEKEPLFAGIRADVFQRIRLEKESNAQSSKG